MGKMKVNEKEIVAPASRMKVSEIKELALVPVQNKLYSKDGRILRDDEIVVTEDAEYGAVTDWTRGARPSDEPWQRCAICGGAFRDDEEPAYEFDTGEEPGPQAAHVECLDKEESSQVGG